MPRKALDLRGGFLNLVKLIQLKMQCELNITVNEVSSLIEYLTFENVFKKPTLDIDERRSPRK